MEKKTRELESQVSAQKEQLARYEKRLKDVVTAYKGLLKEKEALDASLVALTGNGSASQAAQTRPPDSNDDASETKSNVHTLMSSLATLSAEKSRMEASFQSDKKLMLAQIAQRDQNIIELNAQIKTNAELARLDVEEVKAKWIIERQDREKESNNQMLMIRELQKLYADERHLRENIEMQLNNFKTQFASSDAENAGVKELQAQLREAKAKLKELQALSAQGEAEHASEHMKGLQQLQQEMKLLKEQHAVAIRNEQRRALQAEEQTRKQTALHEDRVANLEARLAELSTTVGAYDQLRQRDQQNIMALRNQLEELELAGCPNRPTEAEAPVLKPVTAGNQLPLDLMASGEHLQCQEELASVQRQLDDSNSELLALRERVEVQKTHITTLQEKIQVLNHNIDEAEAELKSQAEKSRQLLREERAKCKAAVAELETEMRCKVNELEQQLQKQRQRSLQLLDEKEHELKALQAMFVPPTSGQTEAKSASMPATEHADVDEFSLLEGKRSKHKPQELTNISLNENCHMLHYVNELARKQNEITSLRKAKYTAESSLHKAIQEKVAVQEELHDKIEQLEEQVDRLERCMSREGANLEYLKNVIINFIVTKDADGKRHMLNAISAVLQLTPNELQTINTAFQKK